MTINLFTNTSPSNYVDKAITPVVSLEGTLREPTSIIDPIIVIQRDSPVGFNYAYIPDFNRYYFVKEVVSVNNSLISVAMHIDVLMTFKTAIRGMDAIIKRQENKWNLYLDDGIFKSYQNSKHKYLRFPNGFNEFSFILALAGNGS